MASRNSICLKTKKEIIRDCTELNKKKSDVAIEHNLSINTIYSILKQKNRILQSARKTSTIKLRDGAFKELDERLYQYTCECKSNSQHVSNAILKTAAKKIASELQMLDFKASNGYISRFKNRFSLDSTRKTNKTKVMKTEIKSESDMEAEDEIDLQECLSYMSDEAVVRSLSVSPAMNSSKYKFETLLVENPEPFVFHVQLNRPKKYNAISRNMWGEIKQCFEEISVDPDCRSVVLSGNGNFFCAGIDLTGLVQFGQELGEIEDVGRKGQLIGRTIELYQDSMSSLEKCAKPVIAAIHSGCIGAGVNIITAADIRMCSKDAWFQIKEVDIGMAADVGVLQRLPKVIGNQSIVRELVFTARKFESEEASRIGLLSKVYKDKEEMMKGAMEMAQTIARMGPIAVQATKECVVHALSYPTQEGLDKIKAINKLMLQSEDFANAVMARATKGGPEPVYSKL